MEDRGKETCPKCGSIAQLRIPTGTNSGWELKPQFFEHLDTKPVWINSKAHLKEECRKRGVRAKCLD